MCGICGVVSHRKPVEKVIIASMMDALHHRGPDDAGYYFNKKGTLGLGHRRLSIIDLSPKGRQPLSNEDKSIWIVFNGEIYNFQGLRKRLIQKGHRFISHTDSEVVVHLYEEYKEDISAFLDKLRGMFAFAIWDRHSNRLLLARDRTGQKPLYYTTVHGSLSFASEMKALLRLPWLSKEVDLEGLDAYFTLGYIPGNKTIFRDIQKLPPAHYLQYDFSSGNIVIHRYWDLPRNASRVEKRGESDLLEELEHILMESIRLRMISDVPIGVFLSGGVDSSTVAAIMAELASEPIKTFSIGFEENRYNELNYARKVAHYIASEHHEFIVRPDHLIDIVEKIPRFFDEPFADSSAIPTFVVSKLTRDHVKVALAGDGGDELFAGYNWYCWVQRGMQLARTLGPLKAPVALVGRYWPFWLKGKHFLERLSMDADRQFLRRIGIFQAHEKKRLFHPALYNWRSNDSIAIKETIQLNSASPELIDQMSRWDFHNYLPEDILVKVDRTSMAVSLEVRAPLLDHYLCEFAFRLPVHFKFQRGIRKYIFKKIARKYLPAQFPLERKRGFNIPINDWMKREPLKSLLQEAISHPGIAQYLNTDYVSKLITLHRRGLDNYGVKLWSVLVFFLWMDEYL